MTTRQAILDALLTLRAASLKPGSPEEPSTVSPQAARRASAGFAELELKTNDGQAVPQLLAGDLIVVSANAAAVLSGVLQ